VNIRNWLTQARPVIGMIHLLALPGAPKWQGSLDQVLERACADAKTYAAAGFDALLVENFGDVPFSSTVMEPHTVAAMAWVLTNLRREVAMPTGVNVLRNDWRAALALAVTCRGSFIRVNVHCGVMVTDQGIITGNAHDCLRYRSSLEASHLGIFADVWVKHGQPLGYALDIVESARELLYRGLADGLIVTGRSTGDVPRVDEVVRLRQALPDAAIIAGSGVHEGNAETFAPLVDAVIVGTGVKHRQITANAVSPARAERLVRLWKQRQPTDLPPIPDSLPRPT
jgi:membrane complex biogenesis BtpA family protein